MHPEVTKITDARGTITFQFPLLGIFPCTLTFTCLRKISSSILSIPVTWDFSMHLVEWGVVLESVKGTFNSRYLGFFHAP